MLARVASVVWGVSALIIISWGCVAALGNETCPLPQEIEHGHLQHLVQYVCDPYYELRSPSKGPYRCDQEKQLWLNKADEAELPFCEPVCGRPAKPVSQVQRIIGGFMAAKNSFPWQIKMLTRHNRTVGATLITDQWLLTTGKNLYLNHSAETPPEEIAPTLRLFLGDGQLASPVERIVLHPNFSGEVDLALLRLQHKVAVGEAVMPICLPKKDYVKPGRVGFISGWGRNVFFAHPERLRYVQLPVADSSNCKAYFEARGPHGLQPLLGEHTFCVGMSELREDTCFGDAGGAFVVQDPEDKVWYAAGILSFDKTCTTSRYSVYERLFSVVDWIKETLASA